MTKNKVERSCRFETVTTKSPRTVDKINPDWLFSLSAFFGMG
ncbi:hypothetical protein HMPREF0530_2688 [Lacticaseibacillus paracasei subsp. paracasei ATCC 25302 = DSM 5622 = JCM 8130]|nr:hypothetical protein HMPREF0530_2688 [Lacticaseibacillus paracasei subsp. paracasei ATCC 25302 = DSM 5622 = JCM 8130]